MDPISAGIGIAGVGATLAQSLFPNRDALTAAMMQMQLQKKIADQQHELATAGTTDGRGNQQTYIPGRGWVTTLSDATRGIVGASDAEERARLTEDQPRARAGRRDNFERRGNEDALARVIMRQMQSGVGRTNADATTGLLAEAGAAGLNNQTDGATNAIAMQQTRSGRVGSGDQLAQLDMKGMTGLRSVLADARLKGGTEATTRNAANDQTMMGQYNTLATRADNVDSIPFAPTTQNDALTAAMTANKQTSAYGLGQSSAALGRGFDPLITALSKQNQPNFGAAIASGGDILSRLFADKKQSGQRDNSGNVF